MKEFSLLVAVLLILGPVRDQHQLHVTGEWVGIEGAADVAVAVAMAVNAVVVVVAAAAAAATATTAAAAAATLVLWV